MARYLYPAIFEPEDGAYNVTFPDLPDCYTCGDNLADAMMMAQDVLADVLPFFLITASVMAVTYVVTLPLYHLALLLAARVVLGAGLYLGTLKVLRVKIFEEALDFLTKRMKK